MSEVLKDLERKLLDEGELIQAGFVGLRIAAIPANAPPLQIEEMRNAFFAGAQHLFSSIMTVLIPAKSRPRRTLGAWGRSTTSCITDYQCRRFPAEGRA